MSPRTVLTRRVAACAHIGAGRVRNRSGNLVRALRICASGEQHLILGHESPGRVEQAPDGCGFVAGDLIVGIVCWPDPEPCIACAAGEWDMCRNGKYTERGIKERHGYGAERFRIEPEFAVKIDPALGILGVLLEPASILAKAWDHTDRIGQRSRAWAPRTLLVTGAGPIGLLAALMRSQRGLEVHVVDRGVPTRCRLAGVVQPGELGDPEAIAAATEAVRRQGDR